MRIAILGTGVVGAAEWTAAHQPNGSHGTFAEAAAFGHVVFNCTNGAASLDALNAAGADNLADKILIDVANPLDFSKGMPPTLTVCNTDSLGELVKLGSPMFNFQIQRAPRQTLMAEAAPVAH